MAPDTVSPTPYEIGVIHGRFQILHNDHLRYLLAGMNLCRHLVVGITNPDPHLSREDQADPHRSTAMANPLTYYERLQMMRLCLEEEGIPLSAFTIVPLPINMPDLFRYYVPMDAVFFLTIYDDWGRKKLRDFKSLGLLTHVLWDVNPEQKGISAADVRRRILAGEPWEHLVPARVSAFLRSLDIQERLRQIQHNP
ncbi:MAG TPA: nicotinate-nucleotide adenylyltransferase [Deltaproteobacteria bacterium]|nr:nicotinate-nucleotide adenylyltransferase [Deltaproteobacteria bacterium]